MTPLASNLIVWDDSRGNPTKLHREREDSEGNSLRLTVCGLKPNYTTLWATDTQIKINRFRMCERCGDLPEVYTSTYGRKTP